MDTIDLAHAKDHHAELVARAAKGEDVCIVSPDAVTVRLIRRNFRRT